MILQIQDYKVFTPWSRPKIKIFQALIAWSHLSQTWLNTQSIIPYWLEIQFDNKNFGSKLCYKSQHKVRSLKQFVLYSMSWIFLNSFELNNREWEWLKLIRSDNVRTFKCLLDCLIELIILDLVLLPFYRCSLISGLGLEDVSVGDKNQPLHSA
jgi:hypothetical protein